MKEKKDIKPKQEPKLLGEENTKPKPEKKSPKEKTAKPKAEKKAAKPKTKPPQPQPQEQVQDEKEKSIQQDPPTIEEIEDIKEDILEHGLLNPYALILYNYMRVSSYETNVQVVLSMRESMLTISRINQIILDEIKQDKEGD